MHLALSLSSWMSPLRRVYEATEARATEAKGPPMRFGDLDPLDLGTSQPAGHPLLFAMYRCDDDKAVSHTSTAVEVDLPIDEVFRFLSDIQNASVWHPLVRGATKWVRAKASPCRSRSAATATLAHAPGACSACAAHACTSAGSQGGSWFGPCLTELLLP